MALFDKVKETATSIAAKAGDLFNTSLDKLKQTVDDLMDGAPNLEKVGYRLTDVELELAMPPRAIVHLEREFIASEEAFLGALNDHKDNNTMCTVLQMLKQVNYVSSKMSIKNREFKALEIDLTIPPSVRMRYIKPKNE